MKRRIAPALVLFLITPLIAEYLLGSVSLAQIDALPVLCLMYGGGGVLIRETARASGRGWPTIALLGAAYAVAEEAFATQALFNRHFHGLSLLEYGYIPALGIGAWCTTYVIGLHVIWSVCVPIAIVEALFPTVGAAPWLGWIGRSVFGLLLILGIAAIALGTYQIEHFAATSGQFIAAGLVLVAFIAAALGLRFGGARKQDPTTVAPSPQVVGVFCFVAGSVFQLSQILKETGVTWLAPVAVMILVGVASIVVLIRWSRGSGWETMHTFAAAAGGLLVYCWFGYSVVITLHGRSGLAAHSVLVALAILLIAVTGLRLNRYSSSTDAKPVA